MTQQQVRARLRHELDQLKATVRNPDRDDGINPYIPPEPMGFSFVMLAGLQRRRRTKRVAVAVRYLIVRIGREAARTWGG